MRAATCKIVAKYSCVFCVLVFAVRLWLAVLEHRVLFSEESADGRKSLMVVLEALVAMHNLQRQLPAAGDMPASESVEKVLSATYAVGNT